jgi:hypothetical protein
MRKTITFIITAMLASTSAQAQMYKCTDPSTGRVTFSQTQCATAAAPVEIDVHRPSADQVQAHRQQVESNQRFIDENQARRQAELEAIAQSRRVAALEAARARELANIHAKRARANNNQAGATYLNALSQDEANANARYEAEMDRLRGVR